MWFAGIPFRGGYGGGFRGLMLSAPVERRSDVVHMKKRTPAEVKKLADHPELAENSPIPVASHHVSHYLHLVLVTKLRLIINQLQVFRGFGIYTITAVNYKLA